MFSLLQCVKTISWAYPVFYSIDPEGSLPESKSGRGVKLTTHLNLQSSIRLHRVVLH